MALSSLKQVPIAALQPDISESSCVVHGIVTLVWPYSSVNYTFSFLLVEPDFRLRKHQGQVRVSLRGSCARRVTRAGLVSGDEIYLAIDGAQWRRDQTAASTPGRGIEWELVFTDHLRLERVPDNGNRQLIDTSRMSESPEPKSSDNVPSSKSNTSSSKERLPATPTRATRSHEEVNTWSSPIFLKDRGIPNIFPLKSDLNPFPEEADWESGNPSKKVKFGRKSDQWRFVQRSPSPEDANNVFHDVVEELGDANPAVGGITQESSNQQAQSQQASNLEDGGSTHVSNRTTYGIGSAGALPESNGEAQIPKPSQWPGTRVSMQSSDASIPVADNFRDNVLVATTEREYQQPNIDGQNQSLALPSIIRNRNSLSPGRHRSPSRTPEPDLIISIQAPTPLVQPLVTDLQPITPRLQPLASPGLDIVSPIETRHRQQANVQGPAKPDSYFDNHAQSSQLTVQDTETTSSHKSQLPAVNLEASSETSNNKSTANGSVRKPDSFFDRLLAQYDWGTIPNTVVSGNLDTVNSAYLGQPQTAPMLENDIFQSLSTQSLEVAEGTTNNLTEKINEEGDSALHTYSNEGEEDEEQPSYEEESSKQGKNRDMTYKPSFEDSSPVDVAAESPLMTDHLESEDFIKDEIDGAHTEQISVRSSSPVEPVLPIDDRAIQDTYFINDDLGQETLPLLKTAVRPEVEVVDLLDSTSSPEPDMGATRGSKQEMDERSASYTLHGGEVEPEESIEDGDATPKATKIVEDKNSSAPETTGFRSALDMYEVAPSSEDQEPLDSEEQQFYTAPADATLSIEKETLQSVRASKAVSQDESEQLSMDGDILLPPPPQAGKTSPNPKSQKPDILQFTESEANPSLRTTRSQSQQSADQAELPIEGDLDTTRNKQSETTEEEQSTSMAQGLRTAHDYYATLPTLKGFYNNTTSVLAVAIAYTEPLRSSAGPRDFNQTLYLTSPNATNDDFTIAQLFRPYPSALPSALPPGAVVLLKDVKVQTYKRKPSLLSTETSGWVIFDHASASNQSDMKISNPGPPVEFGAAERGLAWGLGKWWSSLEAKTKAQPQNAANNARDKTSAELKSKAAASTPNKRRPHQVPQSQPEASSRRHTRSSSQSQTLPSSIPNTQTTPASQGHRRQDSQTTEPETTSPSTHRRTRSSTQAAKSTTPPATVNTSARSPSTTPTPTPASTPSRKRHNLRSSPVIPESQSQGAEHELRSGLIYSDNESELAEIPGRSLVDETGTGTSTSRSHASAARGSGNASQSQSGSGRKTRSKAKAQSQEPRKETKSASPTGTASGVGDGEASPRRTRAAKATVWHELRDGAVYKD